MGSDYWGLRGSKPEGMYAAESLKYAVGQYLAEFYPQEGNEGIKETPQRYVKFLLEFCSYPEPKYTTFDAENYDQMIVQSNIPFYSLCEHHMVPFFGVASVGYIPKGEIVGLSKLARCVEYFSRGLQNQERITQQVANKLHDVLSPQGVGVVITARHLCMEMRGVKKAGATTTTTALTGCFKKPDIKKELIDATNHHSKNSV